MQKQMLGILARLDGIAVRESVFAARNVIDGLRHNTFRQAQLRPFRRGPVRDHRRGQGRAHGQIMRNVRTDSWASSLTEEQSWQLYYKSRALRWNEAADWAVKEYGVEAPSRTAFYAWLGRMRAEESAHRLEQAATAAAEAAALAKTQTSDEAQIAAYKAMATELALRTGSAKEAEKFIQMAATLADKRLKAAELKLKDRAQQTKDPRTKPSVSPARSSRPPRSGLPPCRMPSSPRRRAAAD